MTLKDELGVLPRILYILVGMTLGAAVITSDYADWGLIASGKMPPFGFILINLIALPLAAVIILWAVIGRHREWRVADGQIRIRLLSLTSWQKTHHIKAEDIGSVTQESYDYQRGGSRIAHGWIVVLKDGRRLVSPKSYDAKQLDEARLHIESHMRAHVPEHDESWDPIGQASRANGLD